MKKFSLAVLGLLFLFVNVGYGKEVVSSAKKPVKTPAKKAAAAPKNEKLFVKAESQSIIFYTGGTMYVIQPESVSSAGNMMYFAAKDFTDGKDLITKKIEKIECRVDAPEKKIYKVTMQVGDKSIDPNYRLEIFAEILKGQPYLALYTKFFYLGEDVHKCGINWGLSSPYASDPYKYYTISKDNKIQTFRLKGDSNENKIGYAKWLYLHNGKGSGVGLICTTMLGKGEDFVFINSVPPEKELTKTESSDIFMLYMPISKNFKILDSIYTSAMKLDWTFN